jgi:hypothetical protein
MIVESEIRERAYKFVAYSAVGFSFVSILVVFVTLPMVNNYVNSVHNRVHQEMEFCKVSILYLNIYPILFRCPQKKSWWRWMSIELCRVFNFRNSSDSIQPLLIPITLGWSEEQQRNAKVKEIRKIYCLFRMLLAVSFLLGNWKHFLVSGLPGPPGSLIVNFI